MFESVLYKYKEGWMDTTLELLVIFFPALNSDFRKQYMIHFETRQMYLIIHVRKLLDQTIVKEA